MGKLKSNAQPVKTITNMANGSVYMLVGNNGKPLVINSQLPIFWQRKKALEKAEIHGCKIVRLPEDGFAVDMEKLTHQQKVIYYKKEDFR